MKKPKTILPESKRLVVINVKYKYWELPLQWMALIGPFVDYQTTGLSRPWPMDVPVAKGEEIEFFEAEEMQRCVINQIWHFVDETGAVTTFIETKPKSPVKIGVRGLFCLAREGFMFDSERTIRSILEEANLYERLEEESFRR